MSSTKRLTPPKWTSIQVHLHQTDSHLLRAIEEALARIDRHAFGVCENCKRPISPVRLEAVPRTRLCRDCKEQQG